MENPNPKIAWEEAKLSVPTEPTAWPADRDERISVNSFGVAGSNAHVSMTRVMSLSFRSNLS